MMLSNFAVIVLYFFNIDSIVKFHKILSIFVKVKVSLNLLSAF